jgi:hypothetical protein
MEIPEIPKVFFIRAVFKHTARSIETIVEMQKETVTTDVKEQLLKNYDDSDQEAWDAQRSVKCATCPQQIQKRHIFIPQSIERTKTGLRYRCHDAARFCSWTCAAYHIQYFLNNDSRFKLLLNKIYEKWEQKNIIEIPPSIHPWRIVDCGGDLTLELFHKLNEANLIKFQNSFEDEDHNELE